jgi:hypothetical protein
VVCGCLHDADQRGQHETRTEDASQDRDSKHVRFSGNYLSGSARVLGLTTSCVTSHRRHGATVATARGLNRSSSLPDAAIEASVQSKDERQQCDYPLPHEVHANPSSHSLQSRRLRYAVAQGWDPLVRLFAR